MESYIPEQKIIGHGAPIPIDKLKILIEKAENAICKIEYFGIGTGFFFQQNIPNIQFNNKYFLMTNNHVLNADSINNNDQILIEYKKKERYIPLNNRIKYTNEKLDFTIIEILPMDSIFSEIKSFFKIDGYIMNNYSKSNYLKQEICIVQHPNGGELSFDKGEIKSINDYEIEHSVSTDYGSSGSPILLLYNLKIIGIHKARYKKYNRGTFMKNILDDINNNMFMIPQNRNYNNNNMLLMPQYRNYNNNNMFKISQNKNELTDISRKINNKKKELDKNKQYFLKVKL